MSTAAERKERAATDHPSDPRELGWGPAALAGVLAALVAFVATQAWLAGTNDPDSMSSVLYFQRIVSGRPLEVTVLTTPKPLLTLVFGATWALVHDWRAIVWETILIHGVCVALAMRLTARVAGLPAGLFVAAALIASAAQLAEVAQANSLVWALAGWLAAGLAVTARPPRFGLAGAALLLAGLARIETWLIVAAATVAMLAIAVIARQRAIGWTSIRSMLPLMIAWLTVPIQLVHDQLLAGDPLYWLSMPGAYTTLVYPDLQPVSVVRFGQELLDRYRAMPLLVVLAAVGFAYLVQTRSWALLVGLAALVGGVLALLGSLAMRGIYVSDRYYEQPELGLLLAAGVGVGALASLLRRGAAGQIAGGLAAVVVALALALPGPLPPQLRQRFDAQHAASADLAAVMPELRRIVSPVDGPAPPAASAARGLTEVDPRRATLYVPRPLQRRIAVELDVGLTRLADSMVASGISAPEDLLLPGQYVYHDVNVDVPPEWFIGFEITRETRLGDLRLVPIEFKPDAYWLLQVAR